MPRRKSAEAKERMIHIRLADGVHKQIKISAAMSDQTMQDWVTNLIEERLKKQKSKVVKYG